MIYNKMNKIFSLILCCLFIHSAKSEILFSQKFLHLYEIQNDNFNSKDTSGPRLYFDFGDAYDNGLLNLEDFKKLDSLKVIIGISDNPQPNKYRVLSYKFTYIGKGTNGPKIAIISSSNLKHIRSLLDILQDGDFIQFADIQVKDASGREVSIDNFGAKITVPKK